MSSQIQKAIAFPNRSLDSAPGQFFAQVLAQVKTVRQGFGYPGELNKGIDFATALRDALTASPFHKKKSAIKVLRP